MQVVVEWQLGGQEYCISGEYSDLVGCQFVWVWFQLLQYEMVDDQLVGDFGQGGGQVYLDVGGVYCCQLGKY